MTSVNYFRAGKVQYIYGLTEKEGYSHCCRRYSDSMAIDTGRKIYENAFPVSAEKDIKYFKSEKDLYQFLDNEAANNLDHVMWPLTPVKWIKPCEMQVPSGYDAAFKLLQRNGGKI